VQTTSTQTRHFYYTNAWQDVEERVGASTSMDTQYVWGVRYIDELACRDDATPERLYAVQDANFNLTSITNTSGAIQERYLIDPYGSRAVTDNSWVPRTGSIYSWAIALHGLRIGDIDLLWCRVRDYHLGYGRWLQRDPLVGVNRYEFSGTDPNSRRDPFGLQTDVIDPGEIAAITAFCAANPEICALIIAGIAILGIALLLWWYNIGEREFMRELHRRRPKEGCSSGDCDAHTPCGYPGSGRFCYWADWGGGGRICGCFGTPMPPNPLGGCS
jgi:RHS repeat-associated protein